MKKSVIPFFRDTVHSKFIKMIFGSALSLGSTIGLASSVQASQIVEDFSTRTQRASGDAVWNQGLGFLMPKVQVTGWDDGTTHDTLIELGDGRHGAFNQNTWSQFATSVDTGAKIIYLNNNSDDPFQFTSFELPAGWTVRPSGNYRLRIYVQGNMVVNGIINCSGDDGSSSTGTGAAAVAGAGGRGRCGGAAGGDGGSRYIGLGTGNGQQGSTPDAQLTGGNPGITSVGGNGAGGGGGGAWTSLNIPNTPSTVSGAGARGTNFFDPDWSEFFGSAGGGGGAGNASQAGGGGGGGGGLIDIHVGGDFTLGLNGFILANGGTGGNTPGQGGAGGAGGGGSIRTWVAGTMTLLGLSGGGPTVDAISAHSGSATTPGGGGGRGGSGWAGRTWVTVGTYVSDPTDPVSIGPSSQLTMNPGGEGTIAYLTSANVEAESTVIDTGSTLATFNSVSIASNSLAQVSVLYAGSVDGFSSDNTGWVSDIAQLNNKRFIKFKMTINNNNATTPVKVDSLTLDYTKGTKSDFDFKSSGCGAIGAGSTPQPPMGMLLFAICLLMPMALLIRYRRFAEAKSKK